MPGGTWIFVLVMLWWIIQAVIQSAQKKQEKERLRKIAQQRSGSPQQARPGGVRVEQGGSQLRSPRTQAREVSDQPVMLAPAAPPAQTGSSDRSKEDLAARRAAQLEELRRRRAAAKMGSSPMQPTLSRPGGGAAGTVTPITPPVQQQPKQQQKQKPKPKPSRRLTRSADKSARGLTRNVNRDEPVIDPPASGSRDSGREAFKHDIHDAHSAQVSAYTKTSAAKPNRQRLINRIKSHEDLRDLFILREILDPPVGER